MHECYIKVCGIFGLAVIRGYCADASIIKHVDLSFFGFHEAFANNPQIIFPSAKKRIKYPISLLPLACSFVEKYIRSNLWKKPFQQKLIGKIGVSKPLQDSLYLLLRPISTCGYNDQKDYFISTNAEKPKGRIAVYSVLMGRYDSVKDPIYVTPGVDYILFTNCDVKADIWQIVKVDNEGLSDLLMSRKIKMLPHLFLPGKYDISIYVDANVVIWGDITMLTTFLSDSVSFAVTAHSVRNKVQDEIMTISELGMVDSTAADSLFNSFIEEGFLDDIGLAECTVLIRKHSNPKVKELMSLWWNIFSECGVFRDQVSIMYAIWKSSFRDYKLLEGHVMNNQFCSTASHNKTI